MRRGFLKTKESIFADAAVTTSDIPKDHSDVDRKGKGKATELEAHVEPQTPVLTEPKDAPSKREKRTYPVITVSTPQFTMHGLIDSRHVPNIPNVFDPLPTALNPCAFRIPHRKHGQIEKRRNGQGLGMFATRDIPLGSIICVEPPLLLAPTSIKARCLYASMQLAERLDSYSRNEFYRLDQTTAAALDVDGWCREAKILHANAVVIAADELETTRMPKDSADTAFYMGLFMDYIPHVRHSCSPNAGYYFDSKSFALVLTAYRPIQRGEEITISLINPAAPTSMRQSLLQELSGNPCQCAACETASEESDQRREKLRRWFNDDNAHSLSSNTIEDNTNESAMSVDGENPEASHDSKVSQVAFMWQEDILPPFSSDLKLSFLKRRLRTLPQWLHCIAEHERALEMMRIEGIQTQEMEHVNEIAVIYTGMVLEYESDSSSNSQSLKAQITSDVHEANRSALLVWVERAALLCRVRGKKAWAKKWETFRQVIGGAGDKMAIE